MAVQSSGSTRPPQASGLGIVGSRGTASPSAKPNERDRIACTTTAAINQSR